MMVFQVPTIRKRVERDLEVASVPEVRRLIRDAVISPDQVPGLAEVARTGSYNDLDDLPSGGGGLAGEVVVTVPLGFQVTETVAAVGVTPSSRIVLSLAPALVSDENDPEMLDVSGMAAAPGTDQITITASFATLTSGPVKFNWSAF